MKHLARLILLFISVHLSWTASTSPGVLGYKVYYGTSSRVYSYTYNVGNVTNYTINNVNESANIFFAVTAYSLNQESNYSTELEATVIRTSGTGRGTYTWVKDAENYGQLPVFAIEKNLSKNATLTITPQSDHRLTAIYLNNAWIAPVNPLTITNINNSYLIKYVIQKTPTLKGLPNH